MKRISFLAFDLMFLGVLAISCGSRPTPASVTPLPTIYIPEMSADWQVAYYESLTGQLCVMGVNGRDKVCLEESIPDNSYHGSAWSPDGNQMLISKDKLGMYFWEPSGNFTTFRNSTADETFHEIDWSPNGDFIAYASTELFRRCETCQAYYHDIFIDSLDGSVHRHITAQFTSASSPNWAPDGQSIAFDADGEIFLFSLDANKTFNLTQHDANEMSPKWSPDGRFIAFLSDRAGLATLYVMNSDGSEVREVVDLDINLYGEGLEPEPTQVYTYTWLPDGKRILYSSTIFTPTTERRDYIYINKLIDIETGNIVDVQLPFEGSLAAWYMPSNLEIVPSYQTPLPFEAVSEMPSGEFLFVFLHDDDFTCLDGLCACPVPEMPPDPFKFEGNQLLLAKQDFEPMPDDWIAFRKNRQASILYSFYGSQVSELRLFSSLPLTTPVGNFVIRGVNARGEILVQTPDGTTIVAVGRNAYSQEPEQREEECKVLHKYSLTNYGFIKDEDVRLVTGW
jgi:Tol biopolymer transport system component